MIVDNDIFNIIISQNHIIKNIIKYLTLKECYNLSRTCRSCLKATNTVRKQGEVINFLDYYENFTITSEDGVDITKVFPMKLFKVKFYDPDYIRRIKLKIEIEADEFELIEYTMQDIGKKLSDALFVNSALKELSLVFYPFENLFNYEFESPPVVEPFIGYLIKEIQNNNITVLDICNYDELNFERYGNMNYPTNTRMLDGLPNLKKIKLDIKDLRITHFHKNLINSATRIKNIVIEIDLHMLRFLDSWDFTLLNEDENIITYVLKKKIFLSITNKSIFSSLNLHVWFCTLDSIDFMYIKRIHICVSTFDYLRQLVNYLRLMNNLEWLEIRFDITLSNTYLMEDNNINNVLWNFDVSKSFTNLQKLKTIKIKFFYRDYFLDGENDEELDNLKKVIGQAWEEELFLFLNKGPKCVEKLCFYDMPDLTDTMTLLLNNYFPNLKFLFVRRIDNIDKKCLMNLKNLKFYATSIVGDIEIPKNVEICCVCGPRNSFDNMKEEIYNNDCNLKNKECYINYKSLEHFKKETFFTCSLFSSKIFFNQIESYHDIVRCLKDINEMIQIRNV